MMRYQRRVQFVAAAGLFNLLLPLTGKAESHLNLQGISGQINIPSAFVLDKGRGEFLYSNLFEYARPSDRSRQYEAGISLNAAVGLLDGVEVGVRDVGREFDGGSDMSMNLKWRLPFVPEEWFAIAVGMQDVGGASNYYDARYASVSKKFDYLQLTAGLSDSEGEHGVLNGAFYGVEITPFSWLALLAEHDAVDQHYGVRLSTPDGWLPRGVNANLFALVSSSNDDLEEEPFYGFSLSFPLATHAPAESLTPGTPSEYAYHAPKPAIQPDTHERDVTVAESSSLSAVRDGESPADVFTVQGADELDSLAAVQGLRDALVAHGFENVQVGAREDELVVVFENAVFNANSLDALGLVMGEVVEHVSDDYPRFMVVMQRNGISVFSVATDVGEYAKFLRGDGVFPSVVAQQSPGQTRMQGVVMMAEGGARQRFVPRVTLRPDLETVVGSEVGMLDHTLALNTELEFPLATGLSFYASHNTHLSDSDDYADGWYAERARQTEWREGYLSQTFVLPYNLTTLVQAGKTSFSNETYTFAQNETTLDLAEGRYQLGLIMGKYYDDTHEDDWPVMLGSVRYYWDKPDIRFKALYGNFLGQDVGYRLESRHYFGDTQIYLSYRDTDSRMAGMGIAIPLTPRKDMSPAGGFQLKGASSWSYGVDTVIGQERNPIRFGVAAVPMLRNGIAARYYNHDRLSEVYFHRHVQRLRDAYFAYQ